MSEIKIESIENDIEILNYYDLTSEEQNEIKDNYETVSESSFFRYRGGLYDLNDFMKLDKHSEFIGWNAYHSDSFFSGVIIKLNNSGETLNAAMYFS